jgi:hypothetical protein
LFTIPVSYGRLFLLPVKFLNGSILDVEDGHTLHLVVRQPVSESSTSNAAADPALSAGDSQGSQRSRVVVGSFNIAEQADGVYSDLGQIVSAVLGSLGISNPEGGIEGIDDMGPLHERLSRSSGPGTARDSSGGRSATPNAVDQTSTPLASSQPAAIPDSLTTLSEYLNHLRQEFAANGSNANNLQDSENSVGNVQDSASTTGESRIPRPSHLAEVLQSTRQLLIGEVADCLSVCSFTFISYIPFEKAICVFAYFDSLDQCGNYYINLWDSDKLLTEPPSPVDLLFPTFSTLGTTVSSS